MHELARWTARGALCTVMLFALAVPTSAQTSLDLLGDKDCFGTGLVCSEGLELLDYGGWGLVTGSGDPYPTDEVINSDQLFSWTHYLSSAATSASLVIRTAGIADIRGPYSVFWDGIQVGQFPYDGSSGHILVETFSFSLSGSLATAGSHTVSFTPEYVDSWAIDYAEVVTSVPEPGSLSLLAFGLLGLGMVRPRRTREEAD